MSITCPVCDSHLINRFLFRENFPIPVNLLLPEQEKAVRINRGNLELVFCEECGLIFNQNFDLSKVDYSSDYEIEPYHSPTLSNYVEELVHELVFEKGVQNCQIVEIGCGSGSFLRRLVEIEGSGNRGWGFDPSYTGSAIDLKGRLRFEKSFYSSDYADISPDVLICRHVIEHIPNPIVFLQGIRQTLVNSPHTRVFFETPCVEWTLHNQAFWNFFYEHCLYFNADSLTTAFETAGFQVNTVKHMYKGEYLWLEATVSEQKAAVTKQVNSIPDLAQQFSYLESQFKKVWKTKIQELVSQREKIAIWGAGGTGTTFANLIDPNRQWISCVVDINPKKQGTYMAGTGHPIISYQQLKDFGITCVIVANPNYYEENASFLEKANLKVKLFNSRV